MGFPVLIEPTENRIDDPIHAFHVGEYDHGSCPSAHLDEAVRTARNVRTIEAPTVGIYDENEYGAQAALS